MESRMVEARGCGSECGGGGGGKRDLSELQLVGQKTQRDLVCTTASIKVYCTPPTLSYNAKLSLVVAGGSCTRHVRLTLFLAVTAVEVDGADVFPHAVQLPRHGVRHRRCLRHISVRDYVNTAVP